MIPAWPPRRIRALVRKVEIERHEHPVFGSGDVGDHLVRSTNEVLVVHRQGVVTVFVEERLGGLGEVLVEFELHRRDGASGWTSCRASQAP